MYYVVWSVIVQSLAPIPPSRAGVCAVAADPALDRIAVAPGAAGGGTVRASSLVGTAGGKAVHASAAAVALGADVEVVATVGGARCEEFLALLRERSIACRIVAIAEQTRATYTLVDPIEGDVCEVIEPSPRLSAIEAAALKAAVDAAIGSVGIVLAAGNLPAGVGDDFYAWVVDRARATGAVSLIDAHGVALEHALAAGPDLIKPNLAEALALTGDRVGSDFHFGDLLAVAERLRARGARNVWLTLGARGSLLLAASGEAWRLSLGPLRVVSAVSCGDALLGGLAAGLARGLTLLEAARLGVAAGGDKLGRAHSGLVEPDGVAALLPQVEAEALFAAPETHMQLPTHREEA